MQSSQDLNTSVSASLQEPADMDSIDDGKDSILHKSRLMEPNR